MYAHLCNTNWRRDCKKANRSVDVQVFCPCSSTDSPVAVEDTCSVAPDTSPAQISPPLLLVAPLPPDKNAKDCRNRDGCGDDSMGAFKIEGDSSVSDAPLLLFWPSKYCEGDSGEDGSALDWRLEMEFREKKENVNLLRRLPGSLWLPSSSLDSSSLAMLAAVSLMLASEEDVALEEETLVGVIPGGGAIFGESTDSFLLLDMDNRVLRRRWDSSSNVSQSEVADFPGGDAAGENGAIEALVLFASRAREASLSSMRQMVSNSGWNRSHRRVFWRVRRSV